MEQTYFITGAEGTGKSTIFEILKEELPKAEVHDFDEVGVPENPSLQWRLDTTLHWINKAVKNKKEGKSTVIIGLSFPSEIKNFRETGKINKINFCFLDVDKNERRKRLTKRNSSEEVINDTKQLEMLRKEFRELPDSKVIDTTNLSIEKALKEIINWIKEK